MIQLPCKHEESDAILKIFEDHLFIKSSSNLGDIPFIKILSIQSKNTELFLLKIKLEEKSIIISFSSMSVRDLAKAILLSNLTPQEDLEKHILEINVDCKGFYKNLKNIISTSDFYKNVLCVGYQKPSEDVFSSNFINSLVQPLVDVFISMNYTLNQFYNLVMSSYFFDIKNQKNAVDRILFEKIRDFGCEIDCFTRINSYSFLRIHPSEKSTFEVKPNKGKDIEFEPINILNTTIQEEIRPTGYKIFFRELKCDFECKIEKEKDNFEFDVDDLETARELCKLVYLTEDQNIKNEAEKFSLNFIEMLNGKYGENAGKYLERLVPTYYTKTL